MAFKAIWLLTLNAVLIVGLTFAGETPPVLLPGSSLSVAEGVTSSPNIAIVKFTNVGSAGSGGMGRLFFGGAEISVLSRLKGQVMKSHDIHYTLRGLEKESQPNVIDTYILMTGGPREKIMPATNDNIATVKRLIAGT